MPMTRQILQSRHPARVLSEQSPLVRSERDGVAQQQPVDVTPSKTSGNEEVSYPQEARVNLDEVRERLRVNGMSRTGTNDRAWGEMLRGRLPVSRLQRGAII
jgi:hypothetical protein